MNEQTCWAAKIKILGICCLLALVIAGCKDLNDDPPPPVDQKLRIDVADIQRQLLVNTGTRNEKENRLYALTSDDTVVSSEAKSILMGAVVVTSRSTPFKNDMSIKTNFLNFFGRDLTDSGDFIQIVNLPITETYIEFKVPPPSAGNWQVFAVAFSTQPELVSDLSSTEHKNSAIYFGVNEKFFTAPDIGNTPVPIKLKRVCLLATPPKGCASFGAILTADPVVTASVEIVGIRANGKEYMPDTIDFPIIVRSAADVASAIASLKTIRDEIVDKQTTTSLTVRATHSENTTASEECQALSDITNENEFTNTRLRTHCDVSDYRVSY